MTSLTVFAWLLVALLLLAIGVGFASLRQLLELRKNADGLNDRLDLLTTQIDWLRVDLKANPKLKPVAETLTVVGSGGVGGKAKRGRIKVL